MAKRRRSFSRILGEAAAVSIRGVFRLFGRGTGTRAAGHAAAVLAPITNVATPRGALRFSCASYWSAKRAIGFLKQEPETLAWIEQHIRPGDRLWDVGANVGAYSLYACLAEGVTATSFEPFASTFAILARNVALNGMGDRILPLCVALSDANGVAPLYLADAEAGSSMHALGAAFNVQGEFAAVGVQQTPALRGDDVAATLALRNPDHIKIDVDGHELAVLKGLGGLLRGVRTVWIELDDVGTHPGVRSEIESLLTARNFERVGRGGRNCLFVNRGVAP